MSCRGNKSVQMKDAASASQQNKGKENAAVESVKAENTQIPPGLKASYNASSTKDDNKENIVERNTGGLTKATPTAANENKKRSTGICRGDKSEVKTDILTPVAPSKTVETVSAQSSSKSEPKGNINNSIGTQEDKSNSQATSSSKKISGGGCAGSSSVKTIEAKSSSKIDPIGNINNSRGTLEDKSATSQLTSSSKKLSARGCAGSSAVKTVPVGQGQGKTNESAQIMTNVKTVKTEDSKGGLCSSEKSVTVKENKVLEDTTSRQTVSTDNTKKRIVSNQNEKTIDDKSKEKANVTNVKTVNPEDSKGGLCSSKKSVEVKENKVLEDINKPTVSADNTKKIIVSNQNEKTIDDKSKEKVKTNEINRKDITSDVAVKQLPVGQSSPAMAKVNKDGNSSPSVASDLKGQPIAEKKVNKSRLGLCCSGSSVKVKETVTQKGQPVTESALKTLNTAITGVKKEQTKQIHKVDDDMMDGEENSDIEEQLTESVYEPFSEPQKIKPANKKKKKKSYVDDEPARKKSLAFASRKGKYSVSTDQEEADPMYASIKPNMKGNKKLEKPQSEEENQESEMEVRTAKKLHQGTPKKKKRKTGLDTNDELRSVYESQMASLQSKTYSDGEYTLTTQPTVEEEGDLLENAEEERKKNKQRLREKKKAGQVSPSLNADSTVRAYESAQREIDKVLGPRLSREGSETSHDRKTKEKSKKKKEKKGKDNEGFVHDEPPKEESLEEARERMHKLLDDAFSLISHSKSSISNKVQPLDSSDEPSSSSSKHSTLRGDQSVQASMDSSIPGEKKHTPINVRRTHEPYDSSGLITWSPYRASDEIAVISLPNTQTNLSSQPPQQEKLTTSTFVESAPPRKLSSYFATQPGEPIIIKTKSAEGSLPPTGIQTYQGVTGNSQRNFDTNRKHHETFQNPVYENTLPLRTMDSYSEPYHGLASYQDLPTSHLGDTGRKAVNGRPPVKQSAWLEERSKLGILAPAPPSTSSPRDTVDVRSHISPQRGERAHYDEVDVIKESLQPGASPQPFINSLREELQTLSSKTLTNQTNGEPRKMKSNGSESSWGSMHINKSNV